MISLTKPTALNPELLRKMDAYRRAADEQGEDMPEVREWKWNGGLK